MKTVKTLSQKVKEFFTIQNLQELAKGASYAIHRM